jgi:hypothetical protein
MTDVKERTIREEIEIGGSELVEKVKALVREGNVRQIKITAQDGDVSLELPLTVGVIAGGALVLAAPWLAILGAIAAFVTKVKVEVEREPETPVLPEPETAKG